MITIEKDWILVITSGAFVSILSTLIGAYQEHVKYKDRKKRKDTDDFFAKWMSAEDEVDQLRDENRRLKDKIAKLKIKVKEESENE